MKCIYVWIPELDRSFEIDEDLAESLISFLEWGEELTDLRRQEELAINNGELRRDPE